MTDGSGRPLALVTGTSSGIGLDTAVALARAQHRVVATVRDPARADGLRAAAAAAGVALDVRRLDVLDDASVATCVAEVLRAYGRIDVLVNNAGGGYLAAHEETSMAALRQVMELNFYGVWRTTQAVLPSMRAARSGRIVTVTSIGGLLGQPFNDAYCAAKFAVEGFMESLAPVAARLGVFVSLVEPGPVNTSFVASVQANSAAPKAGIADYAAMRASYLAGTEQAFASMGQSGADVAHVILQAATDAAPHLRYQTSDLSRMLAGRKLADVTGDSIRELTGARLP